MPTRTGKTVEVEFHAPLIRKSFDQTFTQFYWDPEGGSMSSVSGAEAVGDEAPHEEIAVYEIIYLENYPWNTVELERSYTSMSVYDQPVRMAMRAD